MLPNPWDAGTARLLENVGFRALATTSAGLAFSLGRRDGDRAVSVDETFQHIQDILTATTLPVSADLEDGFGESPSTVAETVRRAAAVGLSGASIEDATYREGDPILERRLAVERIQAAAEAARALPHPFVLTARAENFIRGRPDLEDTLWRLEAYEKAGADVLYAPGLPDAHAVRLVCSTLVKPFNYVAGVGPTRLSSPNSASSGAQGDDRHFFRSRCARRDTSCGARGSRSGHVRLSRRRPHGHRVQPTHRSTMSAMETPRLAVDCASLGSSPT